MKRPILTDMYNTLQLQYRQYVRGNKNTANAVFLSVKLCWQMSLFAALGVLVAHTDTLFLSSFAERETEGLEYFLGLFLLAG